MRGRDKKLFYDSLIAGITGIIVGVVVGINIPRLVNYSRRQQPQQERRADAVTEYNSIVNYCATQPTTKESELEKKEVLTIDEGMIELRKAMQEEMEGGN